MRPVLQDCPSATHQQTQRAFFADTRCKPVPHPTNHAWPRDHRSHPTSTSHAGKSVVPVALGKAAAPLVDMAAQKCGIADLTARRSALISGAVFVWTHFSGSRGLLLLDAGQRADHQLACGGHGDGRAWPNLLTACSKDLRAIRLVVTEVLRWNLILSQEWNAQRDHMSSYPFD